MKTLEANSLDVEKEVKEMAGRMNKDRKETARLTENIETLEGLKRQWIGKWRQLWSR